MVKCDHAVCKLYVLYVWCTVHTSPRLAGGFSLSRQQKPVRTMRKITTCQDLKSAENSNCSSSTGFGPTLTTMTKLLASWPASLTQMSAGFPATVCGISNLCSGQRRSQGLRGFQIVALFAVLFVDCEEYLSFLVGFLPSARHAIVCILFSLEQSRVAD